MIRTAILVLLVAATVTLAAVAGSFVAGGSDSSCYSIQAVRWAQWLAHPSSTSLQPADPLALAAPWPNAAATFTPTGHVASRTRPGAFVPICAAGISMTMAPLYLLGGPSLMFSVVPLFGVVLILATYHVGSRYGSRVGVAAAVLVTASPAYLYQVVQPMSDVPAAASWVLAVALATGTSRRGPLLAGLAASGAILMRPNLVPLGFAIGLFVLLRPERRWAVRLRSAGVFAACCAPGCLAVAVIQQYFYGSPFSSGYGAFDTMFAASHVLPNAQRYAAWLWGAYTPAIVIALLAPVLLPGALTRLLVWLFALNVALFLPYTVFEDWTYLRFLLPTLPFVLVLMVAVIDALIVRVASIRPPARDLVLSVVTAAMTALLLHQARARHAFELRGYEARFVKAGRYVATRLPENAIVITAYESGSVPFYSGRRALTWDQLDPAWLDRAVEFVRARGFEPFLLFERWEEPVFRARFAGSALGALDWPPAAEIAAQVNVYRVADRERYRAGLGVSPEYVR